LIIEYKGDYSVHVTIRFTPSTELRKRHIKDRLYSMVFNFLNI